MADTPATALARSGIPVSAPAIPANVLNVSMFFRVLSATPITGLQLGGLTLSNGPVQAFITQHTSDAPRTFQGQVAESGALVAQSGGHHATFAGGVTLQPNTLYGLRLGNSQSGVAPQVQLASTATYTGQGWSGLVLDPYLRWYTNGGAMGEATYASPAATPTFDVLFEVPQATNPDTPLLTITSGPGLTGTVDGHTVTLDLAPIDLSATVDGTVSTITTNTASMLVTDSLSPAPLAEVEVLASGDVQALEIYAEPSLGDATGAALIVWRQDGTLIAQGAMTGIPGMVRVELDRAVEAGERLFLQLVHNNSRTDTAARGPSTPHRTTGTDSSIATGDNRYRIHGAPGVVRAARIIAPGGYTRGSLSQSRVKGLPETLASLDERVASLEDAPLDAIFMSGITAGMPSVGSEGMHYLDTQLGKLWRWIAGAWALVATLSLAAPTPISPDLIAIGDSITYGDQAGGPGSAWPGIVGTRRGWTVDNQGHNGSGLTNADSVDGMVVRYATAVLSGYAGHVVVWGGTNDYNGARPLGQPGDTDPGTIYGALLTLGRGLLTRGPLTLHFITPLWRGDSGRTEGTRVGGYTLEQVRQAVRDMAAQLAREYPGRVQLINAGRDLRDTFSGGSSLMNTDQLHPNAAGQAYLGRYFAAQLWGADGTTGGGDSGGGTIPPEPSTYSRTFSTLAAGPLTGQDGWTVDSGTYTISAGGLSVDAVFSSNPRGALRAMPAGTTRARMLVTSGQPMLHLCHDASNLYYAAWLNDPSGVVDWGALSGTALIRGSGNPLSVPGSGPLWVELEVSGGLLSLRVWRDGDSRPAAPSATPATQGQGSIPVLSGGQAGLTGTAPGTVSVFEIS